MLIPSGFAFAHEPSAPDPVKLTDLMKTHRAHAENTSKSVTDPQYCLPAQGD